MTRDEARKAAAVMLAYAEGKDIQWRMKSPDVAYIWRDTHQSPVFNWTGYDYRIKPEVVRYRRALWKNDIGQTLVGIANNMDEKNLWENSSSFIRWIDTEWQEEEV